MEGPIEDEFGDILENRIYHESEIVQLMRIYDDAQN